MAAQASCKSKVSSPADCSVLELSLALNRAGLNIPAVKPGTVLRLMFLCLRNCVALIALHRMLRHGFTVTLAGELWLDEVIGLNGTEAGDRRSGGL